MHESIDELYARWQQNPDAAQTMALCDALRGSARADLVDIVGSHAARQLDVRALVAAARMYTDSGRLDDAQSVLVAAGRLAPRDGDVYRWLGEVLLRRGDVERAEKVLERAVHFGCDDPAAASALLGNARAHLPAQRLARPDFSPSTVVDGSGPPAAYSHRVIPPAPGEADDEVDTQIRNHDDIRGAIDAALSPLARGVGPAAGAPPSYPQQQTAGIGFLAAPGPSPAYAPPAPVATAPPVSLPAPLPPPAPPPRPHDRGLEPLRAEHFAQRGESAYRGASAGGKVPEPRDVLEALQIAGVYEPEGAVTPQVFAWHPPARGKRRIASTVTLVAMALLFVGGGFGTWKYVTTERAKDHLVAEDVLAKVDADIRTSDPNLLDPSEKAIARAFELESRSPHAALTWLRERAMKGLLLGGEDLAFEEATARAREVGVPASEIAFAQVASFLFQGDTAGAAAMIAKSDSVAEQDPWFHLLAGATFERAGDPRALERYSAAVKLDPELVVAQIRLARAMAVDGDPHRAAEHAKELRAKYSERVEPMALVALAWARDPTRGDPPPEVEAIADKADLLPVSLRAVAHAAKAILALQRRHADEAKPALQKALAVSESPGMAAWIGSIALSMGDEALARKAALTAVSFSAAYPPARVLAARVALLGARLDEALKAVEDLPPSSPDVAVVTAAAAYEKLDAERMALALDGMDREARKLPFVMPLARGQALMAGNTKDFGGAAKVLDMSDDDAPWADLVAMDYALDTGDLELATKIGARWNEDVRAPWALRLARLARYQGRAEDADRLSRIAMTDGGTVTIRALTERVYVLVAANKTADAVALFKAHPNVGGPLAKWLRAYAAASGGKTDEARALVSQEDPPPALAPMPARTIAASAYAAMKDVRHGKDYAAPIVQAGFASPDVVSFAQKLGLAKAPSRRR